jgi:chorismate mutase
MSTTIGSGTTTTIGSGTTTGTGSGTTTGTGTGGGPDAIGGAPDVAGDGRDVRRAPETGAGTAQAAEAIGAQRARIDDLDARIIALVRDRVAVSADIQRTRIASGGRRINLARETEIITTYSRHLGRPGTALAMTLLELCRGRA